MTQFRKEARICPYCLSEEPVTIWLSVDAQKDPDLREKLLRKELQVLDCANCGRHFALAEPLLYRDEAHKLVLYTDPRFEEPEEGWQEQMPQLAGDYPDWQLRLCGTANELIEKIHLFEAGLDDRIMEVVKLALASRLLTEEGRRVKELHFLAAEPERFLWIVEYEPGEGEAVEPEDEEERFETLALSPELYTNAAGLLQDKLPELKGWQHIDEAYARSLIGEA